MNIILATGIYPPAIGGPATYVQRLAAELTAGGDTVTVITYAAKDAVPAAAAWRVLTVPFAGGPFLRWWRYSQVLKREGKEAQVIYAFSAVSVGIPLVLSGLRKPVKVLRLGGDFFWERYTDWRGRKSLRRWYAAHPPVLVLLSLLLKSFDRIVFSTWFQEKIYERSYRKLPAHGVIENALPEGAMTLHARHEPFRILFLGRFVRFKNLRPLLAAVADLPHVTLTLAGEGPLARELSQWAQGLRLKGRLTFLPPVSGEEKEKVLREHDLLILPSLTEISPHTALEARSSGLPVLLTEETGLSEDLRDGMTIAKLQTREDIMRAVLEIEHGYEEVAQRAAQPFQKRGWEQVASEHRALFHSFL